MWFRRSVLIRIAGGDTASVLEIDDELVDSRAILRALGIGARTFCDVLCFVEPLHLRQYLRQVVDEFGVSRFQTYRFFCVYQCFVAILTAAGEI